MPPNTTVKPNIPSTRGTSRPATSGELPSQTTSPVNSDSNDTGIPETCKTSFDAISSIRREVFIFKGEVREVTFFSSSCPEYNLFNLLTVLSGLTFPPSVQFAHALYLSFSLFFSFLLLLMSNASSIDDRVCMNIRMLLFSLPFYSPLIFTWIINAPTLFSFAFVLTILFFLHLTFFLFFFFDFFASSLLFPLFRPLHLPLSLSIQYFWRLNDSKRLESPTPISIYRFWLNLPKNFGRIDAVYERPKDKKVVFFIGRCETFPLASPALHFFFSLSPIILNKCTLRLLISLSLFFFTLSLLAPSVPTDINSVHFSLPLVTLYHSILTNFSFSRFATSRRIYFISVASSLFTQVYFEASWMFHLRLLM